jgi:hypothetical protein
MDKKTILTVTGYCSIALGLYLIHLGKDADVYFEESGFEPGDNIIDAEFEILD